MLSYADCIDLNLSSAAASSGFLSGWCCLASLRYVRLISASVASRATPRTAYRSPDMCKSGRG